MESFHSNCPFFLVSFLEQFSERFFREPNIHFFWLCCKIPLLGAEPVLSHLLKASGFILNLVRKNDQHTEILPNIRQLQNLTVHLRDEGQRKLFCLMHHLHWFSLSLPSMQTHQNTSDFIVLC